MITKKLTINWQRIIDDISNLALDSDMRMEFEFGNSNIELTHNDAKIVSITFASEKLTGQSEIDISYEDGYEESYDERDLDILFYDNNQQQVITDGKLIFENVSFSDVITANSFPSYEKYIVYEEGKINLNVYRLKSERVKLDKDLEFVGILSGNFTNSVGVKNPVIDVENFDLTGTYNYVKIINLNRFYFVDSVELVSKDIRRLYLVEDVLSSFKDLIRDQKGFVIRNENNYNALYPDERRKGINQFVTENVTIPSTTTGSLVNLTEFSSWGTYIGFLQQNRSIVINAFRELSDANTDIKRKKKYQLYSNKGNESLPDIPNLPKYINGAFFSNPFYYPMLLRDETDILQTGKIGSYLGALLDYIKEDDNIASEFASITVYPIPNSLFTKVDYTSYGEDIIIHNTTLKGVFHDSGTNTDVEVNLKHDDVLPYITYIVLADFKFESTHFTDYNDLPPYAMYEIYIPYYGWRELDLGKLINHRILVYYFVDLTNNKTTVYLYDYTSGTILFSASCVLGIELGLSTTNAKEVSDKSDANRLSLTLGLVGSALAIGGAMFTGGASLMGGLAVGGGILNASKQVGSYVMSEKTNYERGQTQFGSSGSAVASPQKVLIRKRKEILNYTLTTDFLSKEGGVCNQLLDLSSVTGYTEIGDIHFEAKGYDIYNDEINEIVTLLKEGIIM